MKGKLKTALALTLGVTMSATLLPAFSVVKAADSIPNVTLTTNISGGISQSYEIKPASGSISLDKVVLRYYYDKTSNKAQSFYCDNAGLNLSVAPYYSEYSKNVSGTFKSDCLEICFNEPYTLSNGRMTLGVRFNQSDWSSYENFKEKKLEVVYDGKIVDTKIYDKTVTAAPTQTVAPTPTATAVVTPTTKPTSTPVPTPTPTLAPTPTPTPTPQNGCILPKCDVDKNGPFETTIDKGYGPNGIGWIVRPANLGTNGLEKHPIFIWNPGGGDQPSLYEGQMRRWASQGFVVYSEESQWSGQQCVDALDWIIEQNENSVCPLYHKLDTTRIAAGGFSLGSVGAYEVASDPRVMTTIHCDGGSFDGTGSGKWRNPTCVMNGLDDGGLASNNTNRDYANAKVPIWYGGIIGGGHGSTVWDGQDAITGWLRWQVGGDTSMRDMFLTPGGRFNNGKFKSQWKNW